MAVGARQTNPLATAAQRGWKLYSFHSPEVECIGKGKAAAPYEFGVKASITSTNARVAGGVFVLHATALHGNPYDGHRVAEVIAATEQFTGRSIERALRGQGLSRPQNRGPAPHLRLRLKARRVR
jgi:IS5 family transposase